MQRCGEVPGRPEPGPRPLQVVVDGTHGHAFGARCWQVFGDALLVAVAERLRARLRPEGTVAELLEGSDHALCRAKRADRGSIEVVRWNAPA